MSADLVRRMIDSAEDANDDLRAKSFHQTISTDTSNASHRIDALTDTSRPTFTSGAALRAELLARAENNSTSHGRPSAPMLNGYSTSIVGATGKDKELRRELTNAQRKDREVRKERFAANPQDDELSERRTHLYRLHDTKRERRQRYNADRSLDTDTTPAAPNAQKAPDSVRAQPRISFREPPSRGYDPFR